MTVETGQQDTQTGAGDPVATGPTPPETPASETPPAGDAEQDDDDQGDQGGRRNREAQYRRRAQAAEAERDQLRGQLDALHRQIVGNVARAYGLDDVGLLEYRGHELSSFIGDDGTVDTAKIIEATADTIKHCNIAPQRRPVRPNAQQGAHGTPAGRGGLDSVINKALGRSG